MKHAKITNEAKKKKGDSEQLEVMVENISANKFKVY